MTHGPIKKTGSFCKAAIDSSPRTAEFLSVCVFVIMLDGEKDSGALQSVGETHEDREREREKIERGDRTRWIG